MPLSKDTVALDVLKATDASYDRGFAAGVAAAREKAREFLERSEVYSPDALLSAIDKEQETDRG